MLIVTQDEDLKDFCLVNIVWSSIPYYNRSRQRFLSVANCFRESDYQIIVLRVRIRTKILLATLKRKKQIQKIPITSES